jgi:hypothetical protein
MRSDERLRAIRKLRPLAVRQYAEARGWTRIDGIPGPFLVLGHPEHGLRQLQIPTDERDPSFVDAMSHVILRLVELEQRSTQAVLEDLQSSDADVLRVRVANHDAEGGQLSLAADVMLREGARRALLASACSVINPVPYHPRMSRSEADSLLAACRAGQTERGSYVVKIVCPLHAVKEDLDLVAPMPFTRRVTMHLMTTTSELMTSIERGNVDAFIDSDAEHPALSSNLCDALVRMQPETGQVELATTWAADPRVRPPTQDQVPTRVVIKAEYLPEIERAAQRLRPTTQGAREEWLIGTVEALEGSVGADGRRSGDVSFSLFLPDGESTRARAILDPDNYEVAVRAHARGHAYVRLLGVLHRGTRVGRIAPLRRLEPWDPQR